MKEILTKREVCEVLSLSPRQDLTIEQAAERAQVSRNTLVQWTKEAGFPIIIYSPRLKRIPVELFDDWRFAKIAVSPSSQAVSGSVSEICKVVEKKETGCR